MERNMGNDTEEPLSFDEFISYYRCPPLVAEFHYPEYIQNIGLNTRLSYEQFVEFNPGYPPEYYSFLYGYYSRNGIEAYRLFIPPVGRQPPEIIPALEFLQMDLDHKNESS
ncbi:hypothetical protein [Nostoc sp. FACHB-280]|uniref:hypothetical protein n=1 Tax=Nostoc sp. FACHB-280 TaxID=2692839 RepID=UPI00168AECA8|nr:hypothetical protein [Nostoc sp. FACHB-280]MBD2493638.1 hypothetical protein [Nostoc sp. FACHB-280]